jgi:hypothetical protein
MDMYNFRARSLNDVFDFVAQVRRAHSVASFTVYPDALFPDAAGRLATTCSIPELKAIAQKIEDDYTIVDSLKIEEGIDF